MNLMLKRLLLYGFIVCSSPSFSAADNASLAKEYFNKGIFYKALFNTAVNTQINCYEASLYLNKKVKNSQEIQREDHLLYYQGLCYYYQGTITKAITDFKRVPESSDKYFEARIRLGACYYKQGKTNEARRLWDELDSKNKNKAILMNKLGNLYAELGINNNRIQTEEIGLGWIYLRENRVDDALRLIDRINAEEPDIIDIRGKWKDITFISEFYDPGILKLKSQVYLMVSAKYYQQAIEVDRKDSLLYLLGISQVMCGRLNESITTLNRTINSNNLQIKAISMINLGLAYYLTGLKKDAYGQWEEVRRNYRKEPTIMSELGYTYSRLGIKLDKETMSLCQNSPRKSQYCQYRLGMVYFKRGIYDRASKLIYRGYGGKRGYVPSVNDPVVLLDLCNAYYNSRKYLESAERLSWLVLHHPEVKGTLESVQFMIDVRRQFRQKLRITWKNLWYLKEDNKYVD